MALQLTFGKIYTFFDIKTVFLIGLVTFEAGSVICATSSGSTMFIIGRVVSGVGGAMVYAGGQTIIGYAVPLGRVSIFMSTLSRYVKFYVRDYELMIDE
jgi:MFS family permease